jgi:thiol-disulfide isomerase/thioredoxin
VRLLDDAAAIPHVGERAREAYIHAFLPSGMHRAFAVAPGGAWGWAAEKADADAAKDAALDACGKHSEIRCVPYALDDRVVFDDKAWAKLWGPYKTRSQAAVAEIGNKRGMRFPDLVFLSPKGRAMKLSDLRGKVVVVHLWGSWCNPCKRELPDLLKLVARLKGEGGIVFVLLPVRESASAAQRWLNAQNLMLPLYDAGVKDAEDEYLRLAGGGKIRDRQLAKVFPATWVLDKHGVVAFSHAGPLEGWLQYMPFLRDVAAESGK